jgi:transcriptional regulator with XRE-family HTH domain
MEAYQFDPQTFPLQDTQARRQALASQRTVLLQAHDQARHALAQLGAPSPAPFELDAFVEIARSQITTGSLEEKRRAIEHLGLQFIWTPGHPIRVKGKAPSTILGALCDWQETLKDTPDPRTLVHERIRAMREAGSSYHQIAAVLNTEGIPTMVGWGTWQASSVSHLCRKYMGAVSVSAEMAMRRAPALERIQALREGQGHTWTQIAEVLNTEGIPTVSGWGKWDISTVTRLYRRQMGVPSAEMERTMHRALAVDRIKALREGEGKSWNQIVEVLHTEGIPTVSGWGRWGSGSVSRLYRQHTLP